MTAPGGAAIPGATAAAALMDALLAAGHRCALEGFSLQSATAGGFGLKLQKAEWAALRLASGPRTMEAAQLFLRDVHGVARVEQGRPRWQSLEIGSVEFFEATLAGPLDPSAVSQRPEGEVRLDPLAIAEGVIRAEIVDAYLAFDAQVTVPIRHGQINFNHATVEHVGPDSRMGVSRMGVYVDAPNGRSYVYQFPAAVDGVEFERRGPLGGTLMMDRGRLQLQPFAESLLRQAHAGQRAGITEQSRQMLGRTALSGEVQLSDGTFAGSRVQVELEGRSQGHNKLTLHSDAVGRGLSVAWPSLSVKDAALKLGDAEVRAATVTATLKLRLTVEGQQLRFAMDVERFRASGLRLNASATEGPA